MQPDFSTITELPNTQVPQEQLERIYQRYAFAASFARDRRVLEIGCGSGQGLGLLAQQSSYVLGLDIEQKNLSIAKGSYPTNSKINLQYADANDLIFPDGAFDLVLIFETIYYLFDATDLLLRIGKILTPGGLLIVESANREWVDFNPSPFAVRYYSAHELYDLLNSNGFQVELFASYEVQSDHSLLGRVLSWAKRTAVRLNLMPKTMKWKAVLKRIFLGKMVLLPPVLTEETCTYSPPHSIPPGQPYPYHKVLFAVGKKASI